MTGALVGCRKQWIVEWLCSNIQHLNKLSQLPFSSGELWRLHQHYFTPVINESGGAIPYGAAPGSRIVSSVPEALRGAPGGSAVTPSTQSSESSFGFADLWKFVQPLWLCLFGWTWCCILWLQHTVGVRQTEQYSTKEITKILNFIFPQIV